MGRRRSKHRRSIKGQAKSSDGAQVEKHLSKSGTKEGPHEKFEALEFRLNDDQPEVGLGIGGAGLILYLLNLMNGSVVSSDVHGAIVGRYTCLRILPRTRSMSGDGHGRISGAPRSVTQARVRAFRS